MEFFIGFDEIFLRLELTGNEISTFVLGIDLFKPAGLSLLLSLDQLLTLF